MRRPAKLIPLICTASLISACSTPVVQENYGEGPGFEQQPEPRRISEKPSPPEIEDCYDVFHYNDPPQARSVYFDFDSYVVGDDSKAVLQTHTVFITKNQRSVVIMGNSDERGSSEYNLALGQKRAEAVRKALSALGVPDALMETISYGEEKPKSDGHDEEAWSQNRRADIVYKAK